MWTIGPPTGVWRVVVMCMGEKLLHVWKILVIVHILVLLFYYIEINDIHDLLCMSQIYSHFK